MLDENKLREAFPNTTVYKDQNLVATFKAASVPAFLRDWILKRKAGADGRIADAEQLRKYMCTIIPRREAVGEIKLGSTDVPRYACRCRCDVDDQVAERRT